jgi:hypothetical protein
LEFCAQDLLRRRKTLKKEKWAIKTKKGEKKETKRKKGWSRNGETFRSRK